MTSSLLGDYDVNGPSNDTLQPSHNGLSATESERVDTVATEQASVNAFTTETAYNGDLLGLETSENQEIKLPTANIHEQDNSEVNLPVENNQVTDLLGLSFDEAFSQPENQNSTPLELVETQVSASQDLFGLFDSPADNENTFGASDGQTDLFVSFLNSNETVFNMESTEANNSGNLLTSQHAIDIGNTLNNDVDIFGNIAVGEIAMSGEIHKPIITAEGHTLFDNEVPSVSSNSDIIGFDPIANSSPQALCNHQPMEQTPNDGMIPPGTANKPESTIASQAALLDFVQFDHSSDVNGVHDLPAQIQNADNSVENNLLDDLGLPGMDATSFNVDGGELSVVESVDNFPDPTEDNYESNLNIQNEEPFLDGLKDDKNETTMIHSFEDDHESFFSKQNKEHVSDSLIVDQDDLLIATVGDANKKNSQEDDQTLSSDNINLEISDTNNDKLLSTETENFIGEAAVTEINKFHGEEQQDFIPSSFENSSKQAIAETTTNAVTTQNELFFSEALNEGMPSARDNALILETDMPADNKVLADVLGDNGSMFRDTDKVTDDTPGGLKSDIGNIQTNRDFGEQDNASSNVATLLDEIPMADNDAVLKPLNDKDDTDVLNQSKNDMVSFLSPNMESISNLPEEQNQSETDSLLPDQILDVGAENSAEQLLATKVVGSQCNGAVNNDTLQDESVLDGMVTESDIIDQSEFSTPDSLDPCTTEPVMQISEQAGKCNEREHSELSNATIDTQPLDVNKTSGLDIQSLNEKSITKVSNNNSAIKVEGGSNFTLLEDVKNNVLFDNRGHTENTDQSIMATTLATADTNIANSEVINAQEIATPDEKDFESFDAVGEKVNLDGSVSETSFLKEDTEESLLQNASLASNEDRINSFTLSIPETKCKETTHLSPTEPLQNNEAEQDATEVGNNTAPHLTMFDDGLTVMVDGESTSLIDSANSDSVEVKPKQQLDSGDQSTTDLTLVVNDNIPNSEIINSQEEATPDEKDKEGLVEFNKEVISLVDGVTETTALKKDTETLFESASLTYDKDRIDSFNLPVDDSKTKDNLDLLSSNSLQKTNAGLDAQEIKNYTAPPGNFPHAEDSWTVITDSEIPSLADVDSKPVKEHLEQLINSEEGSKDKSVDDPFTTVSSEVSEIHLLADVDSKPVKEHLEQLLNSEEGSKDKSGDDPFTTVSSEVSEIPSLADVDSKPVKEHLEQLLNSEEGSKDKSVDDPFTTVSSEVSEFHLLADVDSKPLKEHLEQPLSSGEGSKDNYVKDPFTTVSAEDSVKKEDVPIVVLNNDETVLVPAVDLSVNYGQQEQSLCGSISTVNCPSVDLFPNDNHQKEHLEIPDAPTDTNPLDFSQTTGPEQLSLNDNAITLDTVQNYEISIDGSNFGTIEAIESDVYSGSKQNTKNDDQSTMDLTLTSGSDLPNSEITNHQEIAKPDKKDIESLVVFSEQSESLIGDVSEITSLKEGTKESLQETVSSIGDKDRIDSFNFPVDDSLDSLGLPSVESLQKSDTHLDGKIDTNGVLESLTYFGDSSAALKDGESSSLTNCTSSTSEDIQLDSLENSTDLNVEDPFTQVSTKHGEIKENEQTELNTDGTFQIPAVDLSVNNGQQESLLVSVVPSDSVHDEPEVSTPDSLDTFTFENNNENHFEMFNEGITNQQEIAKRIEGNTESLVELSNEGISLIAGVSETTSLKEVSLQETASLTGDEAGIDSFNSLIDGTENNNSTHVTSNELLQEYNAGPDSKSIENYAATENVVNPDDSWTVLNDDEVSALNNSADSKLENVHLEEQKDFKEGSNDQKVDEPFTLGTTKDGKKIQDIQNEILNEDDTVLIPAVDLFPKVGEKTSNFSDLICDNYKETIKSKEDLPHLKSEVSDLNQISQSEDIPSIGLPNNSLVNSFLNVNTTNNEEQQIGEFLTQDSMNIDSSSLHQEMDVLPNHETLIGDEQQLKGAENLPTSISADFAGIGSKSSENELQSETGNLPIEEEPDLFFNSETNIVDSKRESDLPNVSLVETVLESDKLKLIPEATKECDLHKDGQMESKLNNNEIEISIVENQEAGIDISNENDSTLLSDKDLTSSTDNTEKQKTQVTSTIQEAESSSTLGDILLPRDNFESALVDMQSLDQHLNIEPNTDFSSSPDDSSDTTSTKPSKYVEPIVTTDTLLPDVDHKTTALNATIADVESQKPYTGITETEMYEQQHSKTSETEKSNDISHSDKNEILVANVEGATNLTDTTANDFHKKEESLLNTSDQKTNSLLLDKASTKDAQENDGTQICFENVDFQSNLQLDLIAGDTFLSSNSDIVEAGSNVFLEEPALLIPGQQDNGNTYHQVDTSKNDMVEYTKESLSSPTTGTGVISNSSTTSIGSATGLILPQSTDDIDDFFKKGHEGRNTDLTTVTDTLPLKEGLSLEENTLHKGVINDQQEVLNMVEINKEDETDNVVNNEHRKSPCSSTSSADSLFGSDHMNISDLDSEPDGAIPADNVSQISLEFDDNMFQTPPKPPPREKKRVLASIAYTKATTTANTTNVVPSTVFFDMDDISNAEFKGSDDEIQSTPVTRVITPGITAPTQVLPFQYQSNSGEQTTDLDAFDSDWEEIQQQGPSISTLPVIEEEPEPEEEDWKSREAREQSESENSSDENSMTLEESSEDNASTLQDPQTRYAQIKTVDNIEPAGKSILQLPEVDYPQDEQSILHEAVDNKTTVETTVSGVEQEETKNVHEDLLQKSDKHPSETIDLEFQEENSIIPTIDSETSTKLGTENMPPDASFIITNSDKITDIIEIQAEFSKEKQAFDGKDAETDSLSIESDNSSTKVSHEALSHDVVNEITVKNTTEQVLSNKSLENQITEFAVKGGETMVEQESINLQKELYSVQTQGDTSSNAANFELLDTSQTMSDNHDNLNLIVTQDSFNTDKISDFPPIKFDVESNSRETQAENNPFLSIDKSLTAGKESVNAGKEDNMTSSAIDESMEDKKPFHLPTNESDNDENVHSTTGTSTEFQPSLPKAGDNVDATGLIITDEGSMVELESGSLPHEDVCSSKEAEITEDANQLSDVDFVENINDGELKQAKVQPVEDLDVGNTAGLFDSPNTMQEATGDLTKESLFTVEDIDLEDKSEVSIKPLKVLLQPEVTADTIEEEITTSRNRTRYDTIGSIEMLTDSEEDELDDDQQKPDTTSGDLISIDLNESGGETVQTNRTLVRKRSIAPPSSLVLSVALSDIQVQTPVPQQLDDATIESTTENMVSSNRTEISKEKEEIKAEQASSTEVPDFSQMETIVIDNKDIKIDGKTIQNYKRIISHGGFYKEKCAIVEIFGRYLPDSNIPNYVATMDNLFLYLMATLEVLVQDREYVVVFFNNHMTKSQFPSTSWLRKSHAQVPRTLRKNLKEFYVIQSSFYFKTVANLTRMFLSRKVYKKTKSVKSHKDLKPFIPTEFLFVPDDISGMGSKSTNIQSLKDSSGWHWWWTR